MNKLIFSTFLSTALLGCYFPASAYVDDADIDTARLYNDMHSSIDSDFYTEDGELHEDINQVRTEEDVSLFKVPEGQVTSVKQSLENAYMQSSQLDSARAQQRVTDENVAIALSGWRPSATVQFQQRQTNTLASGKQLSANPSVFNPTPAAVDRPNSHGHSTAFSLSGSQNVFAGGGTYAQTEAAKERVYAGRFNLLSTEQTVLLDTIQAFLNIITNEAIAELRKSSENFLYKTWEQTQVRYEVGEVTRTEVEAAKSSYLGARAERITAEGNVETARATYERVVGTPPGTLGKAEVIIDLPRNLEEAKALALSNNPTVHQAEHNIEAAEYDVNTQIATLLPSVDLSASISRSEEGGGPKPATQLGNNRQTSTEFTTTVSMPLYNKGESRARIRQAHQQVAQSKIELVTAKRQALENTTRAWEDLQSAQSRVESLIAQVQAAKLAVEGVSEEASVGTKNVLDVLEQQDNLVSSQINLVQAEQALVFASYQVITAVGKMTAPDLKLDVDHYAPEDYYDEHSGALIKSWKGDDYRYVKDQDEDND